MASITQAARWINEGKRVRRAAMPTWIISGKKRAVRYLEHRLGRMLSANDGFMPKFTTADILAQDWEIVEEDQCAISS